MKHQPCWYSCLTGPMCNLQMMSLLKVCVWDYEFVGWLRTDGRPPFPLDMTSLQPHQTDLLRCKERERERAEQPECLLHLKKPASVMIDRGRGYISLCPYRKTWDFFKNTTGVQNGLPLNSQTGRKRNGKHNAWIDGLIQEDAGIHKCINIEIQFWSQIESIVLARFFFNRHDKKKLL